jgi:hypothetical protein
MDNFDLKHFLIKNKLTRNSKQLNEAYIDSQGNFIIEDNIVVVIKDNKRKFYLKDNINLEEYFYFKGEISEWNSKNYATQLNKQILEVYKQSAMYTYHKKLKTPSVKNLIKFQFNPVPDHPIEEDFFETDIMISPNFRIDDVSIQGEVGPNLYSGKNNWGLEFITGLSGQCKDCNLDFDKDDTDKLEDLEFRLNNSIIYFIPSLICTFPSHYLDTNDKDNYDKTPNKDFSETKFNSKKQLLDIFNTVGLEALNGYTFKNYLDNTINLKETKYNLYKIKINSTFTNDSDLTQYFTIDGNYKETGESHERAISDYLILVPKEYSLKYFIEDKTIPLRIAGAGSQGGYVSFAENVPLKTLIYGEGSKKFKEKENGKVNFTKGGFDFSINYKQPNIEQVFEISRAMFDSLENYPIKGIA